MGEDVYLRSRSRVLERPLQSSPLKAQKGDFCRVASSGEYAAKFSGVERWCLVTVIVTAACEPPADRERVCAVRVFPCLPAPNNSR